MEKLVYSIQDFDKQSQAVIWKIRGAVINTGISAQNKLRRELTTTASDKLKRKTSGFDKLKSGVIINTQTVGKDNTVKVSVMGIQGERNQLLRIFTASRGEERTTGQRIRRKHDGRDKVSSTGGKKNSRGVLPNLNPLPGMLSEIERALLNNINKALND